MAVVLGSLSDLSKWAENFKELADPWFMEELSNEFAIEYENFATDNFDQSKSPYGESWEPIQWRVSANGNSQKPLQDSGIMENAIHPIDVNCDGFKMVVEHPGANVHQYGATIVPVRARCLIFPGKVTYTRQKGGGATREKSGMIYAKKVRIPARPYLPMSGLPDKLNRAFEDTAENFIQEIIDK